VTVAAGAGADDGDPAVEQAATSTATENPANHRSPVVIARSPLIGTAVAT